MESVREALAWRNAFVGVKRGRDFEEATWCSALVGVKIESAVGGVT